MGINQLVTQGKQDDINSIPIIWTVKYGWASEQIFMNTIIQI